MSVFFFDIGNTNTKIGVCLEGKIIDSYVIPSNDRQTSDQLGLTLESIVNRLGTQKVTACIGSSVVPGMSQILKSACRRYLGVELVMVPHDIPVPLENNYARPYEVGADRLVGAYAARQLFPDVESIISVDFGTATTFDCVKGNAYLGGLICPGVLSSASALSGQTAKLPRINLTIDDKEARPGISTEMSLSHGFVFGFAAMTEGIIQRLSASMEAPVVVVGTGGFAESLARVTTCFTVVKPDLLLEGLRLLYENTKTSKKGSV